MKSKILIFLILNFATSAIFAADTLTVNSQYLSKTDTVLVFKPQYYSSDSAYPLVYMLHGYGGNYSQLDEILDLQQYADDYGFIIVCPDGLYDSWYIDCPYDKGLQWESFFFKDLYPCINKKYSTDTVNIFITGLSMGGHGAMYLFLRHSDKFNAAASSSGVLDLNYSGLKYTSLSNRLGEYKTSKALFDKYSAINQLDSIKFSDKKIFVDCGTKDHLLKANDLFDEACMDRWILISYMTMPGRHNRKYWENSFPWHFNFFSTLVVR